MIPDDDLTRLVNLSHHDPFAVLGRHRHGEASVIRVMLPDATEVRLPGSTECFERIGDTPVFSGAAPEGDAGQPWEICWIDRHGRSRREYDPYGFPRCIPDYDLQLFSQGRHHHAYRFLGANWLLREGIEGVLFATWAPDAQSVSVVGDFNDWDGRRHPMAVRLGSGVWELFVPGVSEHACYKFEIRTRQGATRLKSDPYGKAFELRPANASKVPVRDGFSWSDDQWMAARAKVDWRHTPMSIYEVHLGSWRRGPGNGFPSYHDLAERLVPHARRLGFTHIEILPITEHPFDGSWGYQSTGFYAATSRFGDTHGFRHFVDACHRAGLGVILDWVPAHFPKDDFGLARYDGTALYEHSDPRQGEHPDWGTLIFNYGRNEVRNFLLSSAVFWLEECHVDGLRVDAVASMLYLDYSRETGEWIPNRLGGRENLEAIDFIQQLNRLTHGLFPGTVTIAEESTAWAGVTNPVHEGGLGFSMKWNMGWMNDTLHYLREDPLHRRHHHDKLTFGMMYAFSENFVLPLSHDEVVHMKASLLGKMPGDRWQKFANLRLLFVYQLTWPGKKVLFMGSEIASFEEWNHDSELPWSLLQYAEHSGIQTLLTDLNHLYRERSPLHEFDFEPRGFEWLDCDDADHSVISYVRRSSTACLIAVMNFTPVPRERYRIGLPEEGSYRVILNSDASVYGGSGYQVLDSVTAERYGHHGRQWSAEVVLPPLGALLLERD